MLDIRTFLPALLLLGALYSGVCLTGCGRSQTAAASPAAEAPPITVRTAAAERRTLTSTLTVTGSLQARHEILLPAQGSGVIKERLVTEGTQVKAGQVLLRQDTALLASQLASARADLRAMEAQVQKLRTGARPEERTLAAQDRARAQAAYDKALADFQRADRLFHDGIISRSEWETRQTALQVAEAALRSAEAGQTMVEIGPRTEDLAAMQAQRDAAAARVRLYETQLAQAQVTAPLDGFLVEYLVDLGEMAAPGTPVARFSTAGDLELRLSLPDTQLAGISAGLTVPVTLPALGAATIRTATVFYIAPAADPRTRLFEVRLALPNPANELRAGLVAAAELPLASAPDALVIPNAAVLAPGDDPHVYVLEGDTARQRKVRTGLAADGWIAILDGLQPGERVIFEGQLMVRDGAKATEGTAAPQAPPATD